MRLLSKTLLLCILPWMASAALGQDDAPAENAAYPDGLYAEIETNQGTMVAKLFYKRAPLTVANFVGLAEGKKENDVKEEGEPYYDGLIFHRVIEGFMIQGGDPTGTGRGDPGYRFPDEFHPELRHGKAGILSMANSGPDTNGSQFFITLGPTPHLNDRHTVFGEVVRGTDVLKEIGSVETGAQDRPVEKQVIEDVRIIRSGEDAKAFTATEEAFQKYEQAVLDERKEARKADTERVLAAFKEKFENVQVSDSGLIYATTQEGEGEKPSKGDMVSVHYVGSFLDGTKFDSSRDRGQPIEIPIGEGRVIPGWDEGIMDMKVGERRMLVVPPELGYGSRQRGPIPPNSWLVFDTELVEIKAAE